MDLVAEYVSAFLMKSKEQCKTFMMFYNILAQLSKADIPLAGAAILKMNHLINSGAPFKSPRLARNCSHFKKDISVLVESKSSMIDCHSDDVKQQEMRHFRRKVNANRCWEKKKREQE